MAFGKDARDLPPAPIRSPWSGAVGGDEVVRPFDVERETGGALDARGERNPSRDGEESCPRRRTGRRRCTPHRSVGTRRIRRGRHPAARTRSGRCARVRGSARRRRRPCPRARLRPRASRPRRWSTRSPPDGRLSRCHRVQAVRRGRKGGRDVCEAASRCRSRRDLDLEADVRRPARSASALRRTRSRRRSPRGPGRRSSVTPPEISILAPPRARTTASRVSASGRLSTRIVSAPDASASSTSARLCASTSTGRSGRACRARATAATDASGEPDVIVLDQERVVEPGAMIRAATHPHGVLLEAAKTGRRLAACRAR